MSVIRIATAVHPAWMRTASIVSDTSNAFGLRFQELLRRVRVATKTAIGGQLPEILVSLLTPAAVLALVMGLWRFTADLGWTESFLIPSGFFSHWQVWIALAVSLEILGREPRAHS